jgi:hypothetical protein
MNFADILKRPAASVERPKPLPAGSYHLLVAKHEFGESKEKKTPFCKVTFNIMGPGPDIDPASLAGIDWGKRQLTADFYLTDDALWRFKEFFEKSLGVDIGQRSFGDIIQHELTGKQVMANVVQTPSQKPGDDSIYANINSFTKLQ